MTPARPSGVAGQRVGGAWQAEPMAFDRRLAERVRPLLEPFEPVDERRMFGGLAFLVHEHMAVCVSGAGGLMVRVEADERGELLERDGVETMVMAGRVSKTWVRVMADVLDDDAQLAEWVERGAQVALDLPPKT